MIYRVSKQNNNNPKPRTQRQKPKVAGPSNKPAAKGKPKKNRTMKMTIRGTGGYSDASGNYRRGFSPDYGAQLGSVLGNGLQSLGEVFGFGDYEIRQNTLLGNITMGTDPPTVRNTHRGEATIFTHREYLGDLVSGPISSPGATTDFTIDSYPINPGNSDLFPWLATIGHNFQEWEPNGIIVELKTLSSNYAAGLSMGAMFASTQYNVLAPPPNSKIQLENMEYATSSKPSISCIHAIECARGNDTLTHLYVATDTNYQNGDARLYDLGNLYLGSFGIPVANAPIAEIWVSYEIALYKPTLPTSVGQFDTEHFNVIDISGPVPQGTAVIRQLGSSQTIDFDCIAFGLTGNQATYEFTFPNKIARYLCCIHIALSGGYTLAGLSWGFDSGSNSDCQQYFGWTTGAAINGSTLARTKNFAGTVVNPLELNGFFADVIFDIPALTSGVRPVGRITYTGSPSMTILSKADIWITQISTNVK